jgi:Raf kinase inhibitor-like YbhB/YbcL family protein
MIERAYRLTIVLLAVLLVACRGAAQETAAIVEAPVSIELASPAFAPGEAIPARYTCDGDDISPPLQWQGTPAAAQTLALIMDDPDAPRGTWVHWLLYNIPATATGLPEAVGPSGPGPGGSVQGNNSWNRAGYGGPCPPSGAHRYFFKLYALDTELDLAAGASKEALLAAMEGHILAQGELMGAYRRQ